MFFEGFSIEFSRVLAEFFMDSSIERSIEYSGVSQEKKKGFEASDDFF